MTDEPDESANPLALPADWPDATPDAVAGASHEPLMLLANEVIEDFRIELQPEPALAESRGGGPS